MAPVSRVISYFKRIGWIEAQKAAWMVNRKRNIVKRELPKFGKRWARGFRETNAKAGRIPKSEIGKINWNP
jgi:hypothetical protein